jgi:hypothetical protein
MTDRAGRMQFASIMNAPDKTPKSKKPRQIRFSIEVEKSLGFSAVEVQREIARILRDPRGWAGSGRVEFVASSPGDAHLRFLIARPSQVDRMCRPLRTLGYLSCRQGRRVILNSERWAKAIHHWDRGVAEYRAYLINHETGHYLGYGHVGCRRRGTLAPVMMQQTKGRKGCVGNGWPYPARQRQAMVGPEPWTGPR